MAYNNAVLNNVYNYYLTTYAPKSSTRYDAHKKSELRSVYNSIVKLNKESPLYKLDNSKESKTFAVGIKEDARQLCNVIASLGGLDEEKLLNKKTSFSSNTDLMTVSYTGSPAAGTETPSYDIEVRSLASGQINMGTFLPNTKTRLPADTYSFDVSIRDLNYEFQYTVHEGETNKEIHKRLAKLITNADIGLKADVAEDGMGNTALRICSISEGIQDRQSSLFTISDSNTSKQAGSVAYFGLDYLARPASNAEVFINGEKRTFTSNSFSIDGLYDVTLKGISSEKGETVTIGLKTDVESLTENVRTLINGYNSFIGHTGEYRDDFSGCRRLLGEMRGIAGKYRSEFELLGLSLQEDGTFLVDTNELKHAAFSDYAKEDFASIRNFANSLVLKTKQISLNPMDYVNKTIVAYKNPGKNYATPYITSAFSGMLFNSYC